MSFESIFALFMSIPFAPILILIAFVFLICFILASIIRWIFRKIKFLFALILALLLFSLLSGYLAKNPITYLSNDSPHVSEIIEKASKRFHGFYSSKLPLLAWKIKEIVPPTSEKSVNQEKQPILIKVDYLPMGSIILEYDTSKNDFVLKKAIDQNVGSISAAFLEKAGKLPKALSEYSDVFR